jgi:mannitol/fructose-specific phosphotransferase system IIA component (Ntr-type)
MRLRDFIEPTSLALPLRATLPEDVLLELVGLLQLNERATEGVLKVLRRREELGSTGVGRGIAIPHGRTLLASRARLAYGHAPGGIAWRAVDERPVHHFFLIVAPPVEVNNQYLQLLGKLATFAKEPDVPERLANLQGPEEFFALLEEKGV